MQSLNHSPFCPEAIHLVEAGPGSGKTRLLVNTFIDRVQKREGGIALLSFTNAAVDEARRRCAAEPAALRSPHFIGTFDGFLRQFVVTPAYARAFGVVPSFWGSFDEAPKSDRTVVRLSFPVGGAIPLSKFRLGPDGICRIVEADLDRKELGYFKKVRSANREHALVMEATRNYETLLNEGIMDAALARYYATRLLGTNEGRDILYTLTQRFTSLLVDETQDCNRFEFEFLGWLRDLGVSTVIVGDPDQAIYGFRGGSPDHFLREKGATVDGALGELTINHRSNDQICMLTNALRLTGSAAISARLVAPLADRPIYLLTGGVKQQREVFQALLRETGISMNDAMVLAHRRTLAEKLADGTTEEPPKLTWTHRLVRDATVLDRANDQPRERLVAIGRVENLVLEIFDWPLDELQRNKGQKLAILNKSTVWLRFIALKIARSAQLTDDPDGLRAGLHRILNESCAGCPRPMRQLSNLVQRPDGEFLMSAHTFDGISTPRLRFDTIHGAKGREFCAVLIGLDEKLHGDGDGTVLDHMEQGLASEATRVLYVGVSRAASLLAIGAGRHTLRLESILETYGVKTSVLGT